MLEVADGKPSWVGGNTHVVQVGDILDRGDDEIGILMLLRELHQQAREFGGAVHCLNGNHESLNISGEFRYVTAGAFRETACIVGLDMSNVSVDELVDARVDLMGPGGPIARDLALNSTVLIINDTCFAHGGLLPTHVEYGVKRINNEVSAWMRGDEDLNGELMKPPFQAMGNA